MRIFFFSFNLLFCNEASPVDQELDGQPLNPRPMDSGPEDPTASTSSTGIGVAEQQRAAPKQQGFELIPRCRGRETE